MQSGALHPQHRYNPSCSGLGISALGGGLGTVLYHAARLATEHAELFLDALLALFFSQFAILPELGRGIRGGGL